jgi:hypothetical protein
MRNKEIWATLFIVFMTAILLKNLLLNVLTYRYVQSDESSLLRF